jgi:hypothetical protein
MNQLGGKRDYQNMSMLMCDTDAQIKLRKRADARKVAYMYETVE